MSELSSTLFIEGSHSSCFKTAVYRELLVQLELYMKIIIDSSLLIIVFIIIYFGLLVSSVARLCVWQLEAKTNQEKIIWTLQSTRKNNEQRNICTYIIGTGILYISVFVVVFSHFKHEDVFHLLLLIRQKNMFAQFLCFDLSLPSYLALEANCKLPVWWSFDGCSILRGKHENHACSKRTR